MKTYKILYSFKGEGSIIIEAKNQEEAEDNFYNEDYPDKDYKEDTFEYEIENVTQERRITKLKK